MYDQDLNLLNQGAIPNEFNEGWGLTHDENYMYASDGTEKIFKLDANFNIVETITVNYNGEPQVYINELEKVGEYIYANIWITDLIVKIEASTGNIVKVYDFSLDSKKAKALSPGADVLNGIAYRKETDTFLVTGKQFGVAYEVTFD